MLTSLKLANNYIFNVIGVRHEKTTDAKVIESFVENNVKCLHLNVSGAVDRRTW